MLKFLPIMHFSSAQKSPIMLNIMPIIILIMPQFNHKFYYFNEYISIHSTLYNSSELQYFHL